MSIVLRVPESLKTWFGGSLEAQCRGETIGECIQFLAEDYPNSKESILDEQGRVSDLLLIFLNGQSIRELGGLSAPVADGDQLAIIPLAAGG